MKDELTKNSELLDAETDEEMDGYVWDYSDYPECTGKPAAVETTAVETQPTENNG